jgi:hypothetical protein
MKLACIKGKKEDKTMQANDLLVTDVKGDNVVNSVSDVEVSDVRVYSIVVGLLISILPLLAIYLF